MDTQKFSEFTEQQQPIIRVAGLVSNGAGQWNNVITDDRYLLTPDELVHIQDSINGKVNETRTINGQSLDNDIDLTAADVNALPTSYSHIVDGISNDVTRIENTIAIVLNGLYQKVDKTTTINGKELDTNIRLNYQDVGALSNSYAAVITGISNDVSNLQSDAVLLKANVGALNTEIQTKVNKTTTVNGKPLSGNIQLTNTDVDALPSSYTAVIDSMLTGITTNATGITALSTDMNNKFGALNTAVAGNTTGIANLTSEVAKKVNNTLTINGHALNADIVLTNTDVKAVSRYGDTVQGDLTVTGKVTSTFVGDLTGDVTGALTGNASTASQLNTSRTLTVGNTGKLFNGSTGVTWSLAEIGAVNKAGDTISGDLTVTGKTVTTGFELHSQAGLASTVKSVVGGVESWVLGKLTGTNDLTLRSTPHGVELNFTSAGATLNKPLTVVGLMSASGFDGHLTGNVTGNADTATKLKAPVTLTIGNTGKFFDGAGHVSWTIADIGAVPVTRTVNTRPLSADVVLTPADIGALPASYAATVTALDGRVAVLANDVKDNTTLLGLKVDKTTTVNTKPLSGNVVLNAGDVGALGTEFTDFLTVIGGEVMRLSSDATTAVQERDALLNALYGDIYPRLIAIEKLVGIDKGTDVGTPGTPRPFVQWEHEVWNADNLTAYFSTNGIPFGYMSEDYYDIASTGLRENPDVMSGGVGWAQLNWGAARTVVRVYKSDIKGWADNLSTDVKVILFSNWWTSSVQWKG